MNCYFISDDNYYLVGVESLAECFAIDGEQHYVHISQPEDLQEEIYPEHGDIVVVAVLNHSLRHAVLLIPALEGCRVIIMAKLNVQFQLQSGNPWLVSTNISIVMFTWFLQRIAKKNIAWRPETSREAAIFYALAQGYTISEVAKGFATELKTIYNTRRNVLTRYGLSDFNTAVGTLLCRDVIEIKAMNSRRAKKNETQVWNSKLLKIRL